MKFRLFIKDERGPSEYHEDYDKANIETLKEAETWAHETLRRFNGSLRPHEVAREFVRVELLGDSENHDWEKTNLVTIISDRFGSHDAMKCRVCGITGRRPGLGPHVERDREFMAKGYGSCLQATILLARREERRRKKREADPEDLDAFVRPEVE